ncbi:uncharacterized protein IUM83_01951 [Phytophthora cinnamomi]|uniref:uncharacterized protein n=1 Tax=Phytophthora cinnamomi TaxID=4785 RepID=UPI00355ABF36|nr:hypothetical protein IUM83_01951 [Phytophthora cinnamomi]
MFRSQSGGTASYRYAIFVKHEKLKIWLEDRSSKRQWQTSYISKDDYVTAANAFVDATSADYASLFKQSLGCSLDEVGDVQLNLDDLFPTKTSSEGRGCLHAAVDGAFKGGINAAATSDDPQSAVAATDGSTKAGFVIASNCNTTKPTRVALAKSERGAAVTSDNSKFCGEIKPPAITSGSSRSRTAPGGSTATDGTNSISILASSVSGGSDSTKSTSGSIAVIEYKRGASAESESFGIAVEP